MNDFFKQYASIGLAIATVFASLITQWATYGNRLSNVEDRQDRQGVSIAAMQVQIAGLANDVSGIKAQLTSIGENVNYIRNRIDRITQ